MRRAVFGLVAVLAASCGSRATDMTLGKYQLTVPPAWQAKRDDPERGHLTLVLAPEPATILCRFEVIEGAGALGVEQADVFLTLARRDFPGGDERAVELRTKIGHLHGFALRDAVEARRADVPGAQDRSEVEVYSGVVGGDLVAAVVGGYDRNQAGRAQRRTCIGAIRSLRRAR